MRFTALAGLFALFICSPVCEAAKNPSLEENCAYATQDNHSVDRSAYSKLLSQLRGDTSSRRQRKRTKRRRGKGSTGQR